MTHEEFKQHREQWIREWADKWRHLDIDFEAYMVMKGVTGDEYKRLNEETDDTESDGDGLLGLA
jgi:lysyl-tRNA synthetase class I